MVFGVSLTIGAVVGYFVTYYTRLGAAFVSALAGFLTGMLLNASILYRFSNHIVFWAVCGSLSIFLIISTFCCFNFSFLISSALIGSYFTARGTSLYVGGFPNEFLMIKQAEAGVFEHQARPFYYYLAGILLMLVISLAL